MEESKFVSGFVTLLGRPNAGKSTLLNALVGIRLSIVADKPQTTRTSILGIWNTPGSQVIFLDTPGIHRSDSLYNKRMMDEVRTALEHRDLLVYVADVTERFGKADMHALDLVRKASTPTILVANKIDRLPDKRQVLPVLDAYRQHFEFREYFPISATTQDGLEELRQGILQYMPEGPRYFPEDQLTDQPERFLAAELVREKILHATRQEVPHSVAVFIEAWEEKKTLTYISAIIYVEREGQKGIIIGSRGEMLKTIGALARRDIEKMTGRKVFLELFVKVRENWREDPVFLNQLGFER